jgi:hypothetical protein
MLASNADKFAQAIGVLMPQVPGHSAPEPQGTSAHAQRNEPYPSRHVRESASRLLDELSEAPGQWLSSLSSAYGTVGRPSLCSAGPSEPTPTRWVESAGLCTGWAISRRKYPWSTPIRPAVRSKA